MFHYDGRANKQEIAVNIRLANGATLEDIFLPPMDSSC